MEAKQDVVDWEKSERILSAKVEKQGWWAWIREKCPCRRIRGVTRKQEIHQRGRKPLAELQMSSIILKDNPYFEGKPHAISVIEGGTGGTGGENKMLQSASQSDFKRQRSILLRGESFHTESDEKLKEFARQIDLQIFSRDSTKLWIKVPLFIIGAAIGYAKLVVSDGNITFSFMPVFGMDPVLEHNKKSYPGYSSKTNIFLSTYLPYINFVFFPPYAAEAIEFCRTIVENLKHRTDPIPKNENHNWKRRGVMLGILLLGTINTGLESANYYEVQQNYGTFGRNGLALPLFCVALIWEYYIRLGPLGDRAFLKFFSGATPQIAKMRRELYDLAVKAEWVVDKHLDYNRLEPLYRTLNSDFAIHCQENIDQLAREMNAQVEHLGYPNVQVKIGENLPKYLEGIQNLDQFLDAILNGLTISAKDDAKAKLSELKLFYDPQTISPEQRAIYKVLNILMLGKEIPPFRMDAYPQAKRDHFIRHGLLWSGRLLGLAGMYGFSMAWHYVLGQIGITGPENWLVSIGLSTLRAGNGNMLGKQFVNIYDRLTGFRYPSQVQLEPHQDQYVNQRGMFRRMFSIINGGLFPLAILNQSLRGAGYKWTVDPTTVEVTYDPNNVPFLQAFLPMIPMILILAAPDSEELSRSYGEMQNALQWLPWFRQKRKNGLHRTAIIHWLKIVERSIIHAPDKVVEELYKLTLGVDSDNL